MAFVRAVLLLVLIVLGGYLGFRTGIFYTESSAIKSLIGTNQGLVWASIAGFTVIGVLVGGFASTKVAAQITHLTENLKEMPANEKLAVVAGAIIGLLLTFLTVPILGPLEPMLKITVSVGLAFVLVFLSTQAALSMSEELRKLLPSGNAAQDERTFLKQAKVLDTNIIIDGRITEICRTGFIEGTIYVPGFVLDELQTIADSGDALKRARGRRGLDILNAMQKEFSLVVRTHDHLAKVDDHDPVDSKLVKLAKAMESTIVTNDFNLNKVAGLQGVRVLNVNELANSLKPVVLPGEEMNVHVIKDGKEYGQGIGYLEDGTMVVVEHGRPHVGETVTVTVTSVLQTVAGKMIFSSLKEVADREQEQLDRNLQNYYRGDRGGGGRRPPRDRGDMRDRPSDAPRPEAREPRSGEPRTGEPRSGDPRPPKPDAPTGRAPSPESRSTW